jgi:hypothetical protein
MIKESVSGVWKKDVEDIMKYINGGEAMRQELVVKEGKKKKKKG